MRHLLFREDLPPPFCNYQRRTLRAMAARGEMLRERLTDKDDVTTCFGLRPLVLALVLASPALAGSITTSLQITIQAPFVLVFTPPAPTLACTAAAGTVVTALSLRGSATSLRGSASTRPMRRPMARPRSGAS
jgi:hypothetical protein